MEFIGGRGHSARERMRGRCVGRCEACGAQTRLSAALPQPARGRGEYPSRSRQSAMQTMTLRTPPHRAYVLNLPSLHAFLRSPRHPGSLAGGGGAGRTLRRAWYQARAHAPTHSGGRRQARPRGGVVQCARHRAVPAARMQSMHRRRARAMAPVTSRARPTCRRLLKYLHPAGARCPTTLSPRFPSL